MACVTCAVCGVVTDRQKNAKYCSDKCKGKMQYISGRRSVENQYAKISGSPRLYLQRLLSHKKLGSDVISLEECLELLARQGGRCALSGIEFDLEMSLGRNWRRMSLDQIIPGGGYHKENIRLVCQGANFLRNNMTDDDLHWWCRKVAKHNA
jgi:hypothetical protein